MRVSFQHANPHTGNESFLVRLSDPVADQTACILVDAGTNVSVDDLLADDEYLTAIILTHAHLDHYERLGENVRDAAPIYAAEPTAAILDDVLTEATTHYDVSNVDAVLDALTPISDWTSVTGDVDVRPVPAGHAPGAAAFGIRFDDGSETRTMLATGDWTRRRTAGYPGLSTELDPEAVFLTGATSEGFEDELTGAVATTLERAHAGSTVLLTASGLTAVHLTYLLATLTDRESIAIPSVTLVGHAAKLYETLGYDLDGVQTVRTFDDATAVLDPGAVTIAGPEVPVDGSARSCYEEIRDDPGATLVQVTGGVGSPVESANCTVAHYTYSNHPTDETVDQLVADLAPKQVVVTHQTGSRLARFKDRYDAFTWATTDKGEYTLYEDGQWVEPPWVTDAVARRLRARQYQNGNSSKHGALVTGDDTVPAVAQVSPNLTAEGLNVDELSRQRPSSAARPQRTTTTEQPRSEGSDAPTTAAETGSRKDRANRDDGASTHVEGADEAKATESTEQTDTSATIDISAVTDVTERLDTIERRLDHLESGRDDESRTVQARVIDAGDGEYLLRLLSDTDLWTQLEHGETVDVTLSPAEQPDGQAETDGS
ncbi:MBL fold metallo-hydrolase [Haloarchaeobius sp. DFWS5]|uniref:MBL fold metallo-hydrolase n=1 Tax=Haloarchaeobius sp. DFWS5 TaxID=3446114 RepID=UPI003EB8A714